MRQSQASPVSLTIPPTGDEFIMSMSLPSEYMLSSVSSMETFSKHSAAAERA